MQRVKMENSTPCKIDPPPKNIILKLCTRDYVGEVTRLANFGFNRCSGASPQIAKYYHLVTFLTLMSLPFYSILRPGRTGGLILMLCGSNDEFLRNDGPVGG